MGSGAPNSGLGNQQFAQAGSTPQVTSANGMGQPVNNASQTDIGGTNPQAQGNDPNSGMFGLGMLATPGTINSLQSTTNQTSSMPNTNMTGQGNSMGLFDANNPMLLRLLMGG